MLETDKTALICDLAETYGVYDLKALPLETLAALSAGLREDSRIVMKISGQTLTTTQALLAGILDGVNLLCWLNSEDGRRGRNRPASVLQKLQKEAIESSARKFTSGEEFERERKRILAEVNHAGSR